MSEWRSPPALWEGLRRFARANRQTPTPSEAHLWRSLRNRQLDGYRFRRQHAIREFIVDFYCHDAKLVIEADGSSHEGMEDYDGERQTVLEALGFTVLRFSDDEVLNNLPAVLAQISQALKASS